jgi:hypothetical protein
MDPPGTTHTSMCAARYGGTAVVRSDAEPVLTIPNQDKRLELRGLECALAKLPEGVASGVVGEYGEHAIRGWRICDTKRSTPLDLQAAIAAGNGDFRDALEDQTGVAVGTEAKGERPLLRLGWQL